MVRQINILKRIIVEQAVSIHILSHNVSDPHNQIVITSEIKIDWVGCCVSFKALHSGTQCKKEYYFNELGLDFNES